MSFDTSDMTVFFSDFAIDATPTTWGGADIKVIFDRDLVDLEDVSRTAPYFVIESANVPATAASGDLFTIDGADYKLVDIQQYEAGVKRVILADV